MNEVLVKQDAPQEPAVASESSALISMIERAAKDPNVDIEKMERLFQMHERAQDKAAERAFASSMAAAQAEMGPIARNKKNAQTGSNYADIAAIADAIKPVITKHGFAPSFGADVSPRQGHERVVCDLSHSAGHTRRYLIDVPFDKAGIAGKVNKTDTHALASTHTYGRRLLTVMMFDLATFDDDGNRAGAATITEEQESTLRTKLEETDADVPAFCSYFKIDKLPDLKAADFPRAMQALDRKARK